MRLRGAGAGHQHLLHHLQPADGAEDEGRGGDLRGRGPGRAAGAVRPDTGAVRRPGQRRGGRPHRHQGPDRPADDPSGRKGGRVT